MRTTPSQHFLQKLDISQADGVFNVIGISLKLTKLNFSQYMAEFSQSSPSALRRVPTCFINKHLHFNSKFITLKPPSSFFKYIVSWKYVQNYYFSNFFDK